MTQTVNRPVTTAAAQRYPIRPCTLIYVLLVVLTVITWGLGKAGFSGLGISLIVLGFALFKGFLIGDYYMGLRGIRSIWRWPILIWLLLPGSLITWAFISAS
jgi:cytochrome c oxidase subunit 4